MKRAFLLQMKTDALFKGVHNSIRKATLHKNCSLPRNTALDFLGS